MSEMKAAIRQQQSFLWSFWRTVVPAIVLTVSMRPHPVRELVMELCTRLSFPRMCQRLTVLGGSAVSTTSDWAVGGCRSTFQPRVELRQPLVTKATKNTETNHRELVRGSRLSARWVFSKKHKLCITCMLHAVLEKRSQRMTNGMR